MSRVVALSLLLACCLAAPTGAAAQALQCQPESQCRFKKPNVLFILDYSSSMVGYKEAPAYFPVGQTTMTRWLAELEAVRQILYYDTGFFSDNTRFALSRFGHDPDLMHKGTVLANDASFPRITDGFALDVPFDSTNGGYLECRSSGIEAALEVLKSTPPPQLQAAADPTNIMLTWTRGALLSAHDLIRKTRQAHRMETGEDARDYEIVLMTDGDWSCPDTFGKVSCPGEDPAREAAALREDGIRVHVVAFGDAVSQPSLNQVAAQGGTHASIDATSPKGIVDGLGSALGSIRDAVIVPECTKGLPRILVIMDGSSSMIEGSAAGQTKWDKARYALAGNPNAPHAGDPGYVEPVFSHPVNVGGRQVPIEDVVHLGLVTFAGPQTQETLVGFGPCMRDNFAWALDPATSCDPPGCTNPYGGYPIDWTFKDSATGPTRFVRETRSYMPACNPTPGETSCVGRIENTFTGEGLQYAQRVIADYKRSPSPFPLNTSTQFVNILVTDGRTSGGSSDVQGPLQAMLNDHIPTYVVGFGTDDELDRGQLEQYAGWGGTSDAVVVDPTRDGSAGALSDAIAKIVSSLDLDSCCVLNSCETQPEPADPRAICGDGHVDPGEVCDDGPDNGRRRHCDARCGGRTLVCGDGHVDAPEQCDDGNTVSGDGCDSACFAEVPDPDATDQRDSEVDGGIVVPEAATRTPVPRTMPMAGAAAPSAGATAKPTTTRNAAVSLRPPGPHPSGGGGCSVGPHVVPKGAARWVFALAISLLRRRNRTERRRRLKY